jgi:hypothetical protein
VTKPEFVRTLSRLFALNLLASALTECTYLPRYLLILARHWDDTNYWRNYYLLETACMVLRIAGLSLAVVYFWNAGPKVMRLFTPSDIETKE